MMTSAEEQYNNQVDKMTHSLDIQLLSPSIPVIAQCTHEKSRHGGKYMFRLNNTDSHSPRMTWLQREMKVRSAKNRDQH